MAEGFGWGAFRGERASERRAAVDGSIAHCSPFLKEVVVRHRREASLSVFLELCPSGFNIIQDLTFELHHRIFKHRVIYGGVYQFLSMLYYQFWPGWIAED